MDFIFENDREKRQKSVYADIKNPIDSRAIKQKQSKPYIV